jgi:hypothetical protein
VGDIVDAGLPARFLEDADMNVSGLASLLADLHHSSSVSIETGQPNIRNADCATRQRQRCSSFQRAGQPDHA